MSFRNRDSFYTDATDTLQYCEQVSTNIYYDYHDMYNYYDYVTICINKYSRGNYKVVKILDIAILSKRRRYNVMRLRCITTLKLI